MGCLVRVGERCTIAALLSRVVRVPPVSRCCVPALDSGVEAV